MKAQTLSAHAISKRTHTQKPHFVRGLMGTRPAQRQVYQRVERVQLMHFPWQHWSICSLINADEWWNVCDYVKKEDEKLKHVFVDGHCVRNPCDGHWTFGHSREILIHINEEIERIWKT